MDMSNKAGNNLFYRESTHSHRNAWNHNKSWLDVYKVMSLLLSVGDGIHHADIRCNNRVGGSISLVGKSII